MIKNIICTFAALMISSGCVTATTPVPEADKEMQFIETLTLSEDKIFDSLVDWFAESFVDSKDVLELKDKERGKVIGKGVIPQCFSMGSPSTGWGAVFRCRVTIIIEMKGNRIRTTYKDFTALGKDGSPHPILDKGYNDQARTQIKNLQVILLDYLSKKKHDSNW